MTPSAGPLTSIADSAPLISSKADAHPGWDTPEAAHVTASTHRHTENCPWTAMRTARWWPAQPAGRAALTPDERHSLHQVLSSPDVHGAGSLLAPDRVITLHERASAALSTDRLAFPYMS